MEDRQILELYFARRQEAISETKAKYGAFCLRIAGNILQSREDAEECENDVYLKAWNAIPPSAPDPLAPYLGKLARNLALNRYAYLHAQKRNPELTVVFEELEDCAAGLEPREDGEIARAISRFLGGEQKEARVLFMRRYWYGDSIRDIAARFAFSESKVKSSLLRTRRKLKLYLEKEGFYV